MDIVISESNSITKLIEKVSLIVSERRDLLPAADLRALQETVVYLENLRTQETNGHEAPQLEVVIKIVLKLVEVFANTESLEYLRHLL